MLLQMFCCFQGADNPGNNEYNGFRFRFADSENTVRNTDD